MKTKAILLAAMSAISLAVGATQYSCLSIVVEAKKAGKWDALKAWIASAGLKDEWDKCQYVSDSYPQYGEITNALVKSGVFDWDSLTNLVSKCADTAVPDDLINRIYATDMTTSAGRRKWHGKLVRQVIDKKLWKKVSVYEDGYEFSEYAPQPNPQKVAEIRKRAMAANTNGVPAKLAAARRRWAAQKNADGVTNVTVTVTAGQ